METELKSIAYACISKGIQIFLNDEEEYIVGNRLVCSDCNEPWYMNLTECFVCAAVNPFLYKCENCGNYVSITNAGKKCPSCQEENTLHLQCPNPDCLTNTNPEIFNSINSKGGVYNKNSGFLISCQYCLKCGSQNHNYQLRKIYVRTINDVKIRINELNLNYPNVLEDLSFVIFRYVKEDSLQYSYLSLPEIKKNKEDIIELKDFSNDFEGIIMKIFG